MHNTGCCHFLNNISNAGPTQINSGLPLYANISLDEVELHISPNALKHFEIDADAAIKSGLRPQQVKINAQVQFEDFNQTLRNIDVSDIKPYDRAQRFGNWELNFGAPRNPGELTAVTHALWVGP